MNRILAVIENYRVPKTPAPIKLKLAWQAPRELTLYLADRAESHSGAERPSDLLSGGERFLPAVDGEGRLVLFQRNEVMVLSVGAEHEEKQIADPADGDEVATTAEVDFTLVDGTRAAGSVTYWRLRGQRRLQDYLNTAERFIAVRDGETVHLVNRDRIVSVETR